MNLSLLWNELKNCLCRRKILVIVVISVFLCSIMCGIIMQKPTAIDDYYRIYCDNYVYRVFSTDGGTWAIFFGRFFRNFLLLLLLSGASVVVFLFPVHIFLVFFNGFVFGTEIVILITGYSVVGFFVAILLFLPQYLLLGIILIASVPFSFECGLQVFQDKCFACIRNYLRWLIIFSVIALFSCVLECVTVVFIFKPFAWAL